MLPACLPRCAPLAGFGVVQGARMMRVQWFYAVHDKDTNLVHARKVGASAAGPPAGQGEEDEDEEEEEEALQEEEEAPDDVEEPGPSIKGKGKQKAAPAKKKPAAKKKAAAKVVTDYAMGELEALSCR